MKCDLIKEKEENKKKEKEKSSHKIKDFLNDNKQLFSLFVEQFSFRYPCGVWSYAINRCGLHNWRMRPALLCSAPSRAGHLDGLEGG